jgi:hypothetical protein
MPRLSGLVALGRFSKQSNPASYKNIPVASDLVRVLLCGRLCNPTGSSLVLLRTSAQLSQQIFELNRQGRNKLQ